MPCWKRISSDRAMYNSSIERLWKYIKSRRLLAAIIRASLSFKTPIREVLDCLSTTHAEKLKSLITLNFQRFEDVSLMAA